MDRSQAATSNLMDIHNRLIADILTRYRTLMMLATVQAEDEGSKNTPEAMSVSRISIKLEFDGLYSSIKELLSLSRRLKELWVFGPLGKEDPDRVAREAQLDSDVSRVSALLSDIQSATLGGLTQKHGGTWEQLPRPESEVSTKTTATGRQAGDGTSTATMTKDP